MNDWQTWAALAAVLLAVLFLIQRASGGKKKKGCGHGCGCQRPKR